MVNLLNKEMPKVGMKGWQATWVKNTKQLEREFSEIANLD
jgi:hypothetical protein